MDDILWTLSASAACVSVGLVAGVVFAYANSVMPGLSAVDDDSWVEVNQHLNRSVANPAFLLISNAALLAVLLVMILSALGGRGAQVILAAVALGGYLATLAITFGVNLPLNKRLISAGKPRDAVTATSIRSDFEGPWVRANYLRTTTAILSLVACAALLASR